MLEGLILGVFLMVAEPLPTPAAPLDATQTNSASNPAAPAEPVAETTVPAETATSEAPAATENANTNDHSDQDRVRCRRGPPEIGSIMGRRICSTRRQDNQRAQHDQEEIQRMQQRATNSTGGLN